MYDFVAGGSLLNAFSVTRYHSPWTQSSDSAATTLHRGYVQRLRRIICFVALKLLNDFAVCAIAEPAQQVAFDSFRNKRGRAVGKGNVDAARMIASEAADVERAGLAYRGVGRGELQA